MTLPGSVFTELGMVTVGPGMVTVSLGAVLTRVEDTVLVTVLSMVVVTIGGGDGEEDRLLPHTPKAT
jgi:hypothetical protein